MAGMEADKGSTAGQTTVVGFQSGKTHITRDTSLLLATPLHRARLRAGLSRC
jgi:hypothetical protein